MSKPFNPYSGKFVQPLFIGVGHSKRHGKDTFASFLVDAIREMQPNWKTGKRSFAWKLKQICYDLYSWAGMRESGFYDTEEGGKLKEVILPALRKSPRQIWIDFGTPAVRDQVYDGTWVEYVLNKQDADVIVIPDCRFPNEAARIKELGGMVLHVNRLGYPIGNDVADQGLANYKEWDAVVPNIATLNELKVCAGILAREICNPEMEAKYDRRVETSTV